MTVGRASAGHENADVASYTGCLTPGGALTSMQIGDVPTRPCDPGAVVAHFSGGDITEIIAGPGLTGGAGAGRAALELAPSFRLPQACAADQLAKWDGAGWSCADDATGTGYSAGEGLTLNGTELSLQQLFQLPQDCELGQTPVLVPGLSVHLPDWGCTTPVEADQACPTGQFAREVDESGLLGCAAPPSGAAAGGESTAYLAVERNPVDGSESIGILSNFQPHEMVRLDLPPGTYTFQASGTVLQGPDGFRDTADGCGLTAAGATLQRATLLDAPRVVTISLNSAAHLPSGGAVAVACNTSLDGTYGENFRLVATSVGSLR